MRITTRATVSIGSIVLSFASLIFYCGVLKNRVANLEVQVVIKDKELKAEIDKKVDIEIFNTVTQNLYSNLDLLREDNKEDHNKIDTDLKNISEKIDRLIERN